MGIFDQRLRKDRSASLQLSINAIVVLVMAMVVLGIGLTFIRSMFDKATRNLGSIVDDTKIDNPASFDDPLTVESTVSVRAGKSKQFEVGFYNKANAAVRAGPASNDNKEYIACIDKNGLTTFFLLASPTHAVEAGQGTGFIVIASPYGTQIPGKNIDSWISNPEEKQDDIAKAFDGDDPMLGNVMTGSYVCTLEMFIAEAAQPTVELPSLSEQFIIEVTG
ncbi:hypothetical protein JXA12_05095 [Candidatus Woesearchaeota archaeon]|nr:hypothetical protein [Candidatus Woesearchaeota archaeon]